MWSLPSKIWVLANVLTEILICLSFDFRVNILVWCVFDSLTRSKWPETLFPGVIWSKKLRFLKLVLSYRPFRRREKISREHKSENPVIERNLRMLRVTLFWQQIRIGIYAKSYVYSNILVTKTHFLCELTTQICFWSRSRFCCSRTADQVLRTFDTTFGIFRVESITRWVFFYTMWDAPCKPKIAPNEQIHEGLFLSRLPR